MKQGLSKREKFLLFAAGLVLILYLAIQFVILPLASRYMEGIQERNNLRNELAAGRWVIGSTITAAGIVGHSIVIQSFDAINNRYVYYDPWENEFGRFTTNELNTNTIRLISDPSNFRTLRFFHYCQ